MNYSRLVFYTKRETGYSHLRNTSMSPSSNQISTTICKRWSRYSPPSKQQPKFIVKSSGSYVVELLNKPIEDPFRPFSHIAHNSVGWCGGVSRGWFLSKRTQAPSGLGVIVVGQLPMKIEKHVF